ncbi:MAG: DUF87 domain-containing protein [Minicystis sp.]
MSTPAASPVLTLCADLRLDLADYARTGLRVGIWASSGRGKSFGVGVLCEELLAAGIPVIALDPEGEIFTLRERFRVLVLGGDHADLPLPSGEQSAALALAKALDEGIGLVLDLSDRATSRAQQEAALPFLERLWVLLSERRTPAALVVEEVHVFAPQSGSSSTSDILHRFAKQGRKRGVILVTASQRTQAVSKELMSQLNFQAIGGFEIERDYDAVKAIVAGHPFEEFRALGVGEFFFAAEGRFDRWRPRHTTHGGDAPSFTGAAATPRVADAKLGTLIEELREALAREAEVAAAPDPTRALRAEIRRLEQELERAEEARRAAEAEAARLRIALQVAGVVKVVVENEVVVAVAPPAPRPAAVTAALPGPAMAHAAPAPIVAAPTNAAPAQAVAAPTNAPFIAAPSAPFVAAPTNAPPPASAVLTTSARPAAPTLRDVGIPADRLIELPGVKALIHDARRRARKRSPRSVALVNLAAKLLAGGFTLTADELAVRSGSRAELTIRRAAHALDGLAGAGYAVIRDGRHAANEGALLRAAELRG